MKFIHVTLHVKDLEKSLGFYHNVLELPIVRRNPGPNGPVFLGKDGEPLVELIGGNEKPVFSGFSVGFAVESLEKATKKMEDAGYKKLRGPITPNPQNPSLKFSYFPDPDGVEIQLMESK
ncbi:MAG: VOC family protein [Treponema sp.]|nr:VOC family protein [Treponema sp.]